MALITPPTSDQVYNEAGHNETASGRGQGLGPEHFGLTADYEVLGMVNNEILPTVRRRVNAEADVSAFPYDFPLSTDVWKQARPSFTDAQIAEEICDQEAPFTDAIRMIAAARLLDRVSTKDEFWVQKALRLQEQGEAMLTLAQQSVVDTIKRTTLGQEEGQSGFGMVSIKTDPAPRISEFGFEDVGIYGY